MSRTDSTVEECQRRERCWMGHLVCLLRGGEGEKERGGGLEATTVHTCSGTMPSVYIQL